ncbi:WD40 repeat-like protein [Rhizoctonia solani]|uniref:WD40 repeat-like protein n=1 Tax=Rhizoctonia solani TaxID=456999 RepID=A0A8H7M4L3_9AGAM|nr:WD40 repeat-like protein [Rhizoctonia solani]
MDTQRQTTPHRISIWHIGPHRPSNPHPRFKLSPTDARFAFEGGITSIGTNPAGTLAVVGGDGQVRVVHMGKGEVVGALESHGEGESVEAIAFYGDFVLTGHGW